MSGSAEAMYWPIKPAKSMTTRPSSARSARECSAEARGRPGSARPASARPSVRRAPLGSLQAGNYNTQLQRLREKYRPFKNQLISFTRALDRARELVPDMERLEPVRTIGQVVAYTDQHTVSATDRRILTIFLNLHRDMEDFREAVSNGPVLRACASPETTARMEQWRSMLSPNYDFSSLRVGFPHQELNHLSCTEARTYYGGLVSLLPIALDLATDIVYSLERMNATFEKREIEAQLQRMAAERQRAEDVPTGSSKRSVRIRSAPIIRGNDSGTAGSATRRFGSNGIWSGPVSKRPWRP
ncbi:sperm acrosome-associated protein 9-like [Branchiostoma lanceolatum]|uniref:sperm acrosome-associated protein 9-like n=1 Tax=Branchiostoma lanceolatum TaxID=7740 RepID=UPI00345220B3